MSEILILILLILCMIYIIINIIFSFLYSKYELENDTIVSEIANNLNGKLITSFEFKFSCNLIQNEETLVLGKWPGTFEGCECEGSITKKKCSEEDKKKGCKKIKEINPINFEIINGNLICIKRSEKTYKELLESNQIIDKNKNCPNNYKYCGIIDTFGNKMCVHNDENCPLKINDINQKIKLFLNTKIKNNSSKVDSNNDKLLFNLKLCQNNPCINPHEYYWNFYHKLEPDNQRCITKIKEKIYDDRYELLNEYQSTNLKLYNDNSILKVIEIDDLIRMKLEREQVFLFGRNFLGINFKALEKTGFSYEEIFSFQKKSNTCKCFILLIINIFLCSSIYSL